MKTVKDVKNMLTCEVMKYDVVLNGMDDGIYVPNYHEVYNDIYGIREGLHRAIELIKRLEEK